MTSPYRESDRPIRYICIVCYRTVSTVDGMCGNCGGSPLQLIEGTDEIVGELRTRARAKKQRPDRLRLAFIAITAGVLAIALDAVLLGFRVYDVHPRHGYYRDTSGGLLLLILLAMFLVLTVLVTYLTQWLGLFRTPESYKAFDPGKSDVAGLLSFLGLGAKQEG